MKRSAQQFLAALSLVASSACLADYKLNLQEPVTAIAHDIYGLHNYLLIVCAIIFVVVFGLMFYSIFKHRKSVGHKAANFHESTTVEIVWTIIPLLILIAMAWPATKMVLQQKDTRGADITVKVTGYQWQWGYDYLDEGIGFKSRLATPQTQYENFGIPEAQAEKKNEHYLLEVDRRMVVPVGKKVRVLLTAADVIHSWGVPAFGVKQDAIPGFIRDTWFRAEREGVYRGQCVELCGKDHGFMPIVVEVVSEEKYAAWVDQQKKEMAAKQDDPNKVWVLADLVKRGEEVYKANCVACHGAEGKGIPGNFPALDGAAMATAADQIPAHIEMVLNGSKKNPAMQAWGKTLNDTEIAAVVTYERNAWGNKTGQMIQPAQVKAARAAK